MKECQCRQRLPTVFCFISGTLLAVPVHLVESEPVVPFYIGQFGVGMGIQTVKQGCILLAVRGFQCEDIVGGFNSATVGLDIERHGTDNIIKFGMCFSLLVVVVTKGYDKRNLTVRSIGKHLAHGCIGRCGIDHIAGKDY